MYTLYVIKNTVNNKVYYGITNKKVEKRLWEHKYKAKTSQSTSTILHNAIRKYGEENFYIEVINTYDTREEVQQAEREAIELSKNPLYNMTKGGDGGFVVQDYDDWIEKLKVSRKGRKPALGMEHTEENKVLFQKVSREWWDSQDTYVDKAEEILKLSHKDAKKVYGISTTHYYRLKHRFEQES